LNTRSIIHALVVLWCAKSNINIAHFAGKVRAASASEMYVVLADAESIVGAVG
jgi:hypothetical protein